MLHPFDYSESFRNARESYSGATWPAVLRARNLALSELRRTLTRASRPETRIRSAYQAGRVVQQVREQHVERLNARVAEAERLAQGFQRSLDARRATIAAEQQSLAELGRRQDAWPTLFARAGALTVPGTPTELEKVEHDTTADLRHRLRRALANQLQAWRIHYGAALGAYPYEASPRGQREAVDEVLKAIRERRRVGRVFARSRARLVNRVAGEYATAAEGLTELLRRRAQAEAESGREVLAREITAATSMLAAAREGLATTEAQWRQALHCVRAAVAKRAEDLRILSEAVTVAQRFPDLFVAAYDHRLQGDLARLAPLRDRVEQLAAAMAIVDGARIFDAIREDDVTRPRHGTVGLMSGTFAPLVSA